MSRTKNKPFKASPGPYEAIVIGHLDPSYSGTLKVELLTKTGAGNEPERSGQLLEARYMSPFYGVTPQGVSTGGSGYQDSQKSYGMWMIPPDVGTRVIVILIEGNFSQAYWIGCVQDAYMNFMTPGYASTKQVASLTNDATGQIAKKVPVAEYNKYRQSGPGKNPTKYLKPPHTDLANALQIQGLLEDDVRGTTSSSARREVPSAVFGISTPGPVDKRKRAPKAPVGDSGGKATKFVNRLGGSSFVMDDGDDKLLRKGKASDSPPEYENVEALAEGEFPTADRTLPANELIRIRTRTGHQILLHNTEDLIYIGNARGTSWIELTSNGKIDIYAQDSISVHSANDINFSADRDINFNAGENVNMMVGKQVRTTAGESINNVAGTNYNTTAGQGISEIAGTDIANYANKKASYQSVKELSVNSGRHVGISSGGVLSVEASYMLNIYSNGDTSLISENNLSIRTTSDANIRTGRMFTNTGDFHLDVSRQAIISASTINIGGGEQVVLSSTKWLELNSDEDIFSIARGSWSARAGRGLRLQSEYDDVGIRAENNVKIFAKEQDVNIFSGRDFKQESGEKMILTSNKNLSILSKDGGEPLTIESKSSLDYTAATAVNIKASDAVTIKGSKTELQPSGDVSAAPSTDSELILRAQDDTARLVEYVKWHPYDVPRPQPAFVNETFAPPLFPAQPTPALYADRVARIPMHEPWKQHENLNPLEFTPDKTRAGSESVDVFAVEIPDTFATLPVTQDSLGTLTVSPRFKITKENYFDKVNFTTPSSGDIDEFIAVGQSLSLSDSLARAVIAVLTSQYGEFSHTLAESAPSADGPPEEVADLVRKRYSNMTDKSDAQVLAAVRGNFFYEVYGHATDYGKAIGNTKPADADSYKGTGYYLGIVGRKMWTKLQLANHYAFGQQFSPNSPPADKVLLQHCLARFVEKFYKDHGRGTLGNVRIMFFGSQDYDLSHARDRYVYKEIFGGSSR